MMKRKRSVFWSGIGARMSFCFLLLLLLVIGICMGLSQYVYLYTQRQNLYDAARQASDSCMAGIRARVSEADAYSRLVIYDTQVQEELKAVTEENYMDLYMDPQSAINSRISQALQIASFSSIYLYSMEGLCFSGYRSSEARLERIDLQSMRWFQEVMEADGRIVVEMNAAGAPYSRNSSSYLSLIRCILDIHDFRPVGVAMVNIPETDIREELEETPGAPGTYVILRDSWGNRLTNLPSEGELQTVFDEGDTAKAVFWGKEYFCYKAVYEDYGWTLEYMTPMPGGNYLLSMITRSYFAVLGTAAVSVCVGTFLISRSITRPLKSLLLSMNQVQEGNFVRTLLPKRQDEVYYLIRGYNSMIDRIDHLIGQILKQEADRRKYELEALQAQIKPHFLYNTFDMISYLALREGNREMFSLIRALGNYYRTSLSHGSEFITLEKEIEIVRDYLYILSCRYPELFECEYEIAPGILQYPILRLSLQPFVENAVYHGLKPKGRGGIIRIAARDEDEVIVIWIQDNGVGMDQERIDVLLGEGDLTKQDSFGIRGTIRRLGIYYGCDHICSIMGEPGEGTTVTLRIPKDRFLN